MRLRRAFRRIERPWCCLGLSGEASLRSSSTGFLFKLPATGTWPISTRRYSRVDLAGDDDDDGTSEQHHQSAHGRADTASPPCGAAQAPSIFWGQGSPPRLEGGLGPDAKGV